MKVRAGVAALTLLMILAPASRAWAHAGEAGIPAKDSVEQAIAIISSQPDLSDLIADKINDAIDANDQSGVDIALVQEAQKTYASGDLPQTLLLLEKSVGAKPGQPVINPNEGPRLPASDLPAATVTDHLMAIAGVRPDALQMTSILVLVSILAAAGTLMIRRFR